MMKKIAILQNSAEAEAATEALDLALSLASFDIPTQLILCGSAVECLLHAPSKRYAMLELLDAEPVAVCTTKPASSEISVCETVSMPPEALQSHLLQFDEVFQFS